MSDEDRILREEVRARSWAEPPRPEIAAAAASLVAMGGGAVAGIVFFGSRRSGAARSDVWSAHDFFVIVRQYRSFYRALHTAGAVRRSPALLAAIGPVLPPSQVSLRLADGGSGQIHAKCAVIDVGALARETSARRRDHFCIGRLFQPSEIVYAADEATGEALLGALVSAHTETFGWVRPWLPPSFDADIYCRTLLEVSLRHEIRPEPAGRAAALFAAQRPQILPRYELLLRALAAAGELRPSPGGAGYMLVRPVSGWERLRRQAYFSRSWFRATARWAKHMVTFEDWLEYIVRKIRRHGGADMVLSARERRLPVVFLWPRLIRYLRDKDR